MPRPSCPLHLRCLTHQNHPHSVRSYLGTACIKYPYIGKILAREEEIQDELNSLAYMSEQLVLEIYFIPSYPFEDLHGPEPMQYKHAKGPMGWQYGSKWKSHGGMSILISIPFTTLKTNSRRSKGPIGHVGTSPSSPTILCVIPRMLPS